MKRHTFDLAALKAKGLPRCTFDSLGVTLTPTADASPAEVAETITEVRATVDKQVYLFIPPQKECIGCGAIIAGENIVEAFLQATFTYGLVHGEGFCRRCGYPARANHYASEKDGGLSFMRVLQYHPDELIEREQPPPRALCADCAQGRHLCADEHCPCPPCTAEARGEARP